MQSRALRLTGALEQVIHQQASDETIVLSREIIAVPDNLRDVFGGGAEVIEFRRVRSVTGPC